MVLSNKFSAAIVFCPFLVYQESEWVVFVTHTVTTGDKTCRDRDLVIGIDHLIAGIGLNKFLVCD
jgi:hypothetical protein